MIPYGRQSVSEDDVAAVVEVLRSDFLTQGPAVPRFENSVKQWCGASHAVAMSSATAALHIACAAMTVGPGDLVWTSAVSFVASANCARYCGAEVDFVDVESDTGNMCMDHLEEKLADCRANGGLMPKAVIPVHLTGRSCDMHKLAGLADQYGFSVVEDASHAIGGNYRDHPVGSCTYSDVAVFSFHPVKVVTSAEGGMAVTNNPDLAASMRRLRSHGITREPNDMVSPSHGPWYYEQIELGWNYRMTDLQAALGTSQMNRLAEFVDARHRIAQRYGKLLPELPVHLPPPEREGRSALHLYPIRVDGRRGSAERRVVFEHLRARGIGVQVHYIPIHLQPYYKELGFRSGQFPQAEAYYADVISLPIYPDLTDADQDEVVAVLATAVSG